MLSASWSILITVWIILLCMYLAWRSCESYSDFWSVVFGLAAIILFIVVTPVLWVTGVFTGI